MAALKRILFVDDEPSIRLTLSAILQDNGFQVHSASSVADALSAINSQHFDVLLSDLNISGEQDGFRVVSAMRRVQPHCMNIILTGYPGFDSAVEAIRHQVDDYLVKPADIEGLIAALHHSFERSQKTG